MPISAESSSDTAWREDPALEMWKSVQNTAFFAEYLVDLPYSEENRGDALHLTLPAI